MTKDPTQRFSKTVDNYIRYRPDYPPELIRFMVKKMAMTPESVIADIGSGTGKLTRLFLENGNPTYAVEPNGPMRGAAEQLFGHFPNLISIEAKAEDTGLGARSIDFITAGQAFHWFDIPACREEWRRLLKPDGWVLLIWNKRLDDRSPFMFAYNAFLEEYSTDLEQINLRRINTADFLDLFGNPSFRSKQFQHAQILDRKGIVGRYLSCSYAFDEDHPRHEEAVRVLVDLFEKNQSEGKLKIHYVTEVYYGKLK